MPRAAAAATRQSSRIFANPLRAPAHPPLPESATFNLEAVAAFAPHLEPTPLHDAGPLAQALGLSKLFIKDETNRWGLNAFKITGVSYAVSVLGAGADWRGTVRPSMITCASAGNHGRAVARVARVSGIRCRVFLPADALRARVDAIRTEGADVVQIDGSYEDAVEQAAQEATATNALLIPDTTPPGDPAIPTLIMQGYTKLFAEAAMQWNDAPELVVVQGGVGGLVGAAAAWIRTKLPDAVLIAAEPEGSACLKHSARAGRLTTLESTAPTSMVCLRCAAPSAAAWPFVAAGVDGFVTVKDAEAQAAVKALAGAGIHSGASGACGLAALTAIASEFTGRRAMVIITEGP